MSKIFVATANTIPEDGNAFLESDTGPKTIVPLSGGPRPADALGQTKGVSAAADTAIFLTWEAKRGGMFETYLVGDVRTDIPIEKNWGPHLITPDGRAFALKGDLQYLHVTMPEEIGLKPYPILERSPTRLSGTVDIGGSWD